NASQDFASPTPTLRRSAARSSVRRKPADQMAALLGDSSSKRMRRPSATSTSTAFSAHSIDIEDSLADMEGTGPGVPPNGTEQGTPSTEPSPADGPSAEQGWQDVCYRKRREPRPRLDDKFLSTPPTAQDSDDQPRFVVVFRSCERYDLTSIPVATLQRTFYAAINLNPATCAKHDLPFFRLGKATNTISAIVRSRAFADRLLSVTSITAPDRAVPVIAHEVPPGDTARGVAHDINPTDTPELLTSALRSDSHEILYARPLGTRGLALVTFHGRRPPRTVLYHDFEIRVTPYVPKTVVCRRCHGLGHKEHVCTRPPRCPDCGCVTRDGHVCERTYCANCRDSTHIATHPKCPTKLRVDQQLQQRAKRPAPATGPGQRGSRAAYRRRRRRRARRGSNRTPMSREQSRSCTPAPPPPRISIENFPPLVPTSNRFAPLATPQRNSRSRSRAPPPATLRQPSRSVNRQPVSATPRRRSPSARRAPRTSSVTTYAHAAMLQAGYYPDDDAEVRGWQEELHAIEAATKADTDRIQKSEAALLTLRKKVEEENRRREVRRATILRHLKEAADARQAQRQQQQRQQVSQNPSKAAQPTPTPAPLHSRPPVP
ncbi:unnamed protein product, partial [Ixodes hexagonus]